jgi:hypothetical protein
MRPDALTELEPIAARHHPIAYDEAEGFDLEELPRCFAIHGVTTS